MEQYINIDSNNTNIPDDDCANIIKKIGINNNNNKLLTQKEERKSSKLNTPPHPLPPSSPDPLAAFMMRGISKHQ